MLLNQTVPSCTNTKVRSRYCIAVTNHNSALQGSYPIEHRYWGIDPLAASHQWLGLDTSCSVLTHVMVVLYSI